MTHRISLAGWMAWWAVVAASAGAAEPRCAVLEVFLRGDAERSRAAREYVERTYAGRKSLKLVIRDVAANEKDLDRYWLLADHFKKKEPGLPAFYVSGQFYDGWDAQATPARLDEALSVEVFVRQGCPRCAAAKPVIFQTLAAQYPGYRFVELDIAASGDAARRLQEVSQRYQVQAASVPALHLCGRLMVGFYDAQTSLKQWDDVLKAVTVACAPAAAPAPEKKSAAWRPTAPFSFLGSVAYAGEVRAAPAEDAPPPRADADAPPQRPPATASAPPPEAEGVSSADADAPPPRPKRRLPDETTPQDAATPPRPLPNEISPGGSDASPDGPAEAASDAVALPLIGTIHWRQWGLPAFTFLVGLIDGCNPCAMWVLLFLLSLLVNLQDRWKIFVVAGTFVFISGAAYFAFMAAWLTVFELIGLMRPAQIVLGLLAVGVGAIHIKDFFAFKQGLSLSIPESAKPTIYARTRRIIMAETLGAALVGAAVLAVLVNVIELLCTAGLPAMYTGILSLQKLPAWQNYLYLALYNVAYMFDDSLMVAAVVITLGKCKLQEQGGRILKLVSGAMVLALGLVMLFMPTWLV